MAITPGGVLNSVPAPKQQALADNYLDLATEAGKGWAQQYVPDLMEKEAEVFGPRTISGFLSQVGAEEAMTADQVVWSEQGRLHLSYTGKVITKAGGDQSGGLIEIEKDIDGNDIGTDHGIRVNDTIIIAGSAGVVKCLVTKAVRGTTATTHDRIDVAPYGVASLDAANFEDADAITILVYGSEFTKGVSYRTSADVGINGTASDSRGSNEPSFKSFMNKPIILKDNYEVSGSDASRIGWVEVSSEQGQSGYLWYLKAEADTRARFTDYLEMAMLEAKMGGAANAGATGHPVVGANDNTDTSFDLADGTATGTQGLFDAIETRGNVTSGITGVNAATDLAEFDAILAEFDKQGAIEEYMLFVNRASSLAIDDMLASMNSYGAGGTSYGVFDNDEDMALNLGFSGFRRGSYDFYKSDFRYLNDLATRGGINAAAGSNAIRGVLIPAGTSSVYDQTVGQSIKRPCLHVRFRASATDDRRMKTWVTGSVGAATSALDAMQLHFLSERCLITQGANNFMLMK